MSNRTRIKSNAPWEAIAGYSRLVRIGPHIEISGTVAVEDNEVKFKNDPGGQTQFILEKIETYLNQVGATREDVIRTRMYVTDISRWEPVARAHGSFFKNIDPVTSMVEVSALIDSAYLVEIEVTAFVEG